MNLATGGKENLESQSEKETTSAAEKVAKAEQRKHGLRDDGP